MAGIIDAFTSVPAIITYIVIILVLIAVLAIAVMVSGSGSGDNSAGTGTVVMQAPPAPEKEEENGERFCMLSEIDRKKNTYGHASYERGLTLESLCENFRNYAANKLGLYYSIDDIRKFISPALLS